MQACSADRWQKGPSVNLEWEEEGAENEAEPGLQNASTRLFLAQAAKLENRNETIKMREERNFKALNHKRHFKCLMRVSFKSAFLGFITKMGWGVNTNPKLLSEIGLWKMFMLHFVPE